MTSSPQPSLQRLDGDRVRPLGARGITVREDAPAPGLSVPPHMLEALRQARQCVRTIVRVGGQWHLRCLTHGWSGPAENSCAAADRDTCAVAAGEIEANLRARAARVPMKGR